jgi:hypothetical protein
MKKTILVVITIILMFCSIFVLSSCDSSTWVIEEDTMFYLDSNQESTIKGIPFLLAIDKSKSGILLRKDGTATVTLITNSFVSTLIGAIPDLDSLQLDVETKLMLNTIISDYFPGASLDDIPGALERLEKSVNLKLLGADDPDFKSALEYFGETGTLPENLSIPQGLGIEYNSKYYFQKVNSPYSGEYISLSLGKHEKGGEAPILLTLTQNEEGKRMLTFRFEVLGLYLSATEK